MLTMDLVYVIRHKVHKEGLSRREVARQLGLSRNTVKKYLEQSEPVFDRKVKRSAHVFDSVKQRIDQLWEEWKNKTTQKQRITGTRMHLQLQNEGYKVGITTVRNYIREKRRLLAEVYIPLIHFPGDEAQVDFFEVSVTLDGIPQKAWMFLMRLMYSGRDFAWLYHHCDQVSFLDAHVRAFEHFGGIPARCVYDNLKPAVTKVMFPQRRLSQRFLALSSHYLFEPCFARPGVGHDKGGVESRGKGIRWQELTPIPEAKTLCQLNPKLLQSLDSKSFTKRDQKGRTVQERFIEEQALFRSLPGNHFESRLQVITKASKQATIKVKGALYSLPSHWKHLQVTVFLGPVDLRIVCREEEVLKARVKAREENVSYLDYLEELAKKPQAVRQVSPRLLEELPAPFKELWKMLEESHGSLQTARVFSKIIKSIPIHGMEKVAEALSDCMKAEQVHLLGLAQILREQRLDPIEVPEGLIGFEIESAKATDYDHLLMGVTT